MNDKELNNGIVSAKQNDLFYVLFFFGLIWMSRFLFIDSFGLYEDDWNFIGQAISKRWDENFATLSHLITTFWQGRPLFILAATIIPFCVVNLGGGLKALYWIGFLILATNANLLYSLLVKIFQTSLIPLLATILFCLYPADTTFHYLLHLFETQISLLFLLLSFHCYFSNRKKTSYLFATCSLITYETPFLIFLTAPFWISTHKKEKIKHFLILIIIVIANLLLRLFLGEKRGIEGEASSAFSALITHTLIGPMVSFSSFFVRPLEVVSSLNITNSIILLIATLVFSILFFKLIRFNTVYPVILSQEIKQKLILGIVATILAYPFTVILDIYLINGRASRVHFAAAFGTTLVIACLGSWLWSWLWNNIGQIGQRLFWKRLVIVILSIYLALLYTFCVDVQRSYGRSWSYQRAFWQDILTLVPDLDKNLVILVDAPSLATIGKQINPFDWTVPSVIDCLYEFPLDWRSGNGQYQPRLYLINSSVIKTDRDLDQFIDDQGHLVLSSKNNFLKYYYAWEADRSIEFKDVVLLREQNHKLIREKSINLTQYGLVMLKSPVNNGKKQEIKKTILFNELVDSFTQIADQDPIYFKPQS